MTRPIRTLLAALLFPLAAQAAKPAPKPAGLSAETVNAGTTRAAGPKSSGAHVLRAQILLDRLHFSSGEIDGSFGMNLQRALEGYQRKMGLDVSGRLDEATWEALNNGAAPALVEYTLQDADVAGPFEPVPEAMAGKAQMAALGFASAEEALGEKFHASPALLRKLNKGKDLARAGETILVPNVLDPEPLPKAGRIVVDKSDRTLTLYDTAGTVVAQFPASMGSEKDPLPIGTWKVKGISRNPVFHYNPKLFWDASPADKKERIPAGPNNPVGVAWIDLTKDHYGIHGTPVPASIGKTQSHGCIRLTNWDVAALTTSAGFGTVVEMQE